MFGADLGIARGVGLVVGGHDGVAGPRGEPGEPVGGVEGRGHETLLSGLLGDAHAAPDVGPGGARAAGLVDKVPDQVVGHVAEVVGGDHRVGELVENVRVHGLDGADEVVEPDGIRHADRFRHASTVG